MKEFIFRGTDDGHILNSEPSCELVRCKDCKYGTSYSNGELFGCVGINGLHDANWFCADGVRSE